MPPQQQTFSNVQPVPQSFSDVTPIDSAGGATPNPHADILQKYGLPADVDLTKDVTGQTDKLFAGAPAGKEGAAERFKRLDAFSNAYQEANPRQPDTKGVFASIWDEAKNAIGGMLSEGTGTASAPPVPGKGAADLATTRARQFKENPIGATARTATDIGMAALPLLLDRAPEIWSKVSPAASIESALGRTLTAEEAATPRPGGTTLPALNNTPAEVLNYAKQKGIQLTPGQATESGIAQQLQKAGMTAANGGKDLALALEKERSTFQGVANDFRDTVDPKRTGLSAESAGEAVQQQVKTAREVTHDNATQGYQKINHIMDVPVDASPISTAWNKLRDDLPMGAEDQILAQTPRGMRAVVGDLLSGRPEGFKPTVAETIQLRKFFRDLGDTEGLPDKTQATYQKMENVASSTLDSTASKLGAANEWEAANQGWKDYKGKYGDPKSPLYKILNQRDPTKVITQLSNAPATDIELLKNETAVRDAKGNIVSDGLDPLRRQVVKDIQNSRYNIGNDDGIGGYSHAYLKQLFNDAQLKEIYVQGDLAHRLNYDPNPSGTGSNQAAVSQLTLGNQAKMSIAAKMSMPRDPLSFLSKPAAPAVRTTPFAAQPRAVSPITGGALATPADLFKSATSESEMERMRR